jgi:hypothetical protein
MMATMVVPLGCRSIASTCSCLEPDRVVGFDGFGFDNVAFANAAGFDRTEAWRFDGRFAVRAGLDAFFTGFDLRLMVAIWLSLRSTTASCAATDTTRRSGGQKRRSGWRLFLRQPVQE